MKLQLYLIVSKGGAVSVRKTLRGRLAVYEVAIPIRLEIPDSAFRDRVFDLVTVEVPAQQVVQPTVEIVAPEPDHNGIRQTMPLSLDPNNVPDPVVGEMSVCLICGVNIEYVGEGIWEHRYNKFPNTGLTHDAKPKGS